MKRKRLFSLLICAALVLALTPITVQAQSVSAPNPGADTETVNPFKDVTTDDWFYDNVMYIYQKGLMNGTAPDTFSPEGEMTRAMLTAVLYRLSGVTGSYTNAFSDVPSGAWYEKAAAWAASNGIEAGAGGGRFDPDGIVTREHFAVMLYNYAKYKGMDVSAGEDTNILSYNDAFDILEYAFPALQWACGSGVIRGDDTGNLNPKNPVTRAQFAAMLQRFLEI